MVSLTNFAHGDLFLIEGREHVFDGYLPPESGRLDEPDDLQFLARRTRRSRCLSEREFLTLYGAKKIVRVDCDGRLPDDDDPGAPDALMTSIRLYWTRTFDADPEARKSERKLKAFIERCRSEQPPAPDGWTPSHNTLRRWLRERGRTDHRRRKHMRDRNRRDSTKSRLMSAVQVVLDKEAEAFWAPYSQITYKDVYVKVRAQLVNINRERLGDGLSSLPIPSRSTIWRQLRRQITPERARSRYGAKIAYRAFKAVEGTWEATRLLDLVLGDAERLDCFVVDNQRRFVIGRPWCTLIIDTCSRMVLGFYLSFEDPSVATIMAALRMAIKPKFDLREKYPDLQEDWEGFGLPRCVRLDNAWENTGSSFADGCEDLGISIEWAPVKRPEAKGIVERAFRTINDQLVHKLPGAVTMKPHMLAEYGIDPQCHAVLTLSDINRLLHLYFADIYSVSLHEGLNAAPLKVWREHVRTDHIEIASDLDAVDQALSKHVKGCTLNREGVRFNGLQYRSDIVSDLLADLVPIQPARGVRFGTAKVKIKYHPEDISRIFVWNEVRGKYITLPCTLSNYTEGMSERLHELLKAQDDAENAKFMSENDLCLRKAKFLRSIDETLAEAPVRQRRRDYRSLERLGEVPKGDVSQNDIPVDAVANRRRGDRPEKSARRSRRAKKPAVSPDTAVSATLPLVAAPEASPDPFVAFDREAAVRRAMERRERQ